MFKCRVTVLRRTINQDLIDEYHSVKYGELSLCSIFEDGQEFVIDDPSVIPEKFCAWAWTDLHKYIVTIMFDGVFPRMVHPGTAIICCTDALRPVIFKLERVE